MFTSFVCSTCATFHSLTALTGSSGKTDLYNILWIDAIELPCQHFSVSSISTVLTFSKWCRSAMNCSWFLQAPSFHVMPTNISIAVFFFDLTSLCWATDQRRALCQPCLWSCCYPSLLCYSQTVQTTLLPSETVDFNENYTRRNTVVISSRKIIHSLMKRSIQNQRNF